MSDLIKTIQQTFLEVAHAQRNGSAWYTRGDTGLYQQVSMWLGKGQAALNALEKQLAERDAALARFSSVLSSVANAVEKEAFRMEAPNEHTPVFVGIANFARNNNCGLPASAQATAKVLAAARRLVENGFGYETFKDLENAVREEQETK